MNRLRIVAQSAIYGLTEKPSSIQLGKRNIDRFEGENDDDF